MVIKLHEAPLSNMRNGVETYTLCSFRFQFLSCNLASLNLFFSPFTITTWILSRGGS